MLTMKGIRLLILILVLALITMAVSLMLHKKEEVYYAKTGEVVELNFELDKKFEFGDYYFELNNGKRSTYPLCFCLTEKNTFPPDCSGDVKYLYKNRPGTMCIPLKIGSGRCSVAPISTFGYATDFIIPREYQWTKPFEKIVLGIRVPNGAPDGARLAVAITIFKQNNVGQLEQYRVYEKTIVVRNSKGN